MGCFSTFHTHLGFGARGAFGSRHPRGAPRAAHRPPSSRPPVLPTYTRRWGGPPFPLLAGSESSRGRVRRTLLPCRIPVPASRQYIRRGRLLGPALSCVLFYTRRRNFFLPAWISAPCSCSGLRLYDFGASASPLIFTPPPSMSRLASDTL